MNVRNPVMRASDNLVTLTATASKIVAAYLARNSMTVTDVPALITSVHATLRSLGEKSAAESGPALTPAVPIRKSITPDYMICLEDGKKFKSLRRHLRSLGMTPAEYRAKWGLPIEYPMVAPNYTSTRSRIAIQIGLGTKASANMKAA